MALNYVTLTVDLFDGQGNIPLAGSASFTPSAVLTDAADLEIVGQQPIVASFRLAGLPPVSLLATDNTGPQPSGWTWGVTFSGITGAPAAFSFFLPASPVTYTATNANPAVFTVGSGSAPPNGTGIQLLTGAPTGFVNGTTYFVVGASGATFRLAAAIGGAAIASTSTGAGNMITVSQRLSNLSPALSGTAFQSFMPLPSGIPAAGQVPLATGAGQASAWGVPGQALGRVTVSPTGVAAGAAVPNNGAQFGPDTPGTTTQGLQEAANFAIAQVANITGTLAPPGLFLLPGLFDNLPTINIPVPTGVSTNGIGFEIIGSGHLTTRVRFSSGAGFLFGKYGWQDVVFRNLCIMQLNGGTATSLIAVTGTGSSFPTLRSEMMFENVWFETNVSPAGLPSNGCIFFGPFGGQTGGFDLYFTNCAMAGSFSITSPFNASFVNCLMASGSGVTFTTTTAITTLNSCEITGQIGLTGTNQVLKVAESYWAQIPATSAVSCSAVSGTTGVTVRDSSLNFLGTGVIASQSAGVIELHFHGNAMNVAASGTFALAGGGAPLSHTSTYGGNYPDGFFSGTGDPIQGTTLPANPPVSGTGYQNTFGVALNIAVPITYSPTAGAAATCQLIMDTGALTAVISTETYPANSTTGYIRTLRFRVPPGWFYKITTTNASIGTATVVPEQ